MRSTCLTVSLSAIEENYRRIRAALPPRVQVIAVVKADAYGHGAVPCLLYTSDAADEL